MTRNAPRIFLSSTSKDLINEREICVKVIQDNRFVPNNMENWGASPDTVKEKLVTELNNSAGVILILGFQYGSIMNQEGISYTEFEFDFSKNEGLPILSFIKLDENGEWKNDEENEERKRLLDNFKSKIKNEGFIVDCFSSGDELRKKVERALFNNSDRFYNNLNFTDKFFERKLENTIANLSQRYNSEFNVDMKMDFLFDSISKNDAFKSNFKKDFSTCYCQFKEFVDKNHDYEDYYSHYLEKLKDEYHNLFENNFQSFNDLFLIFNQINNELNRFYKKLDDKYQKDEVSKLIREFDNFINKSDSIQYNLVENPFLLLVGEAGIGKSHLLAHMSKKRLNDSEISILLLGSYFNNQSDIGQQIVRILDLDIEVDKFLHKLNEKAKFHNSRILIMIDGLNESRDKTLWNTHLNGFVNQIKQYSNLGLIVSIRTTYENLIPDDNLFLRYNNFDYDIMDAIKIYCEAYNVSYPSFPILYHEFSNHLFLKILFENISNNGGELSPDKIGFFNVIDEYIGRIDKGLHLNFDLPRRQSVTENFVKKYVECKINNGSFSYGDALNVGRDILKDNTPCLIDVFEEENLFTIIEDEVFITFEKIEDYLTACYLLNNVVSESLLDEFKEGGYIFNIINSNFNNYLGVLESFAILIPEFFGLEVYEIDFSDFKKYNYIKGHLPYWFIDSLYWRKPESVNDNVFDYINASLTNEYIFNKFMDSMILLSFNEDYVLNAEKLHECLFKMPLKQRDGLWTTWIHHKYYESDSVHKLVNWILSLKDPKMIPVESVKLLALTLSWFLSSTNNKLRDDTTYALIYLLKDDVESLLYLLKRFEGVDDLYIYERLFAVAYGVALRNNDFNKIKSLVGYVYSEIFSKDDDYTHILLRDYARGIVRYGEHLDGDLEFDESKLWMMPTEDIFEVPNDENMDEIKNKVFNDVVDGYSHIFRSMNLKFGDFGRYVFDSSFNYWKEVVNVEDLQKIALKQVFDLYDVELHGEFDNLENRHRWDRHYSKTERIGKKYQWIVFYNLLGVVSEKYKLKDLWTSDDLHYINGPWEIYERNFDPSINFKNNNLVANSIESSFLYNIEEMWSKKIQELINIDNLIIQSPFENDEEWLVLNEYINWDNLNDVTFSCKYDKSFDLSCQCLIFKKEDKKEILTKLSYERLLDFHSEGNEFHQVYDREFQWSKSYDDLKLDKIYQTIDYKNFDENNNIHFPYENNSFELAYASKEFFNRNYYKPSKFLFDNFDLKYGEIDNVLYSNDEPIVVYISGDNFWKLLINKKVFLSFLHENNLDIIWKISATKINFKDEIRDSDNDIYMNGILYLNNEELTGTLEETPFDERYVGDVKSRILHLSSCGEVESLLKEDIKLFHTINDASNQGFELCYNCLSKFIE